MAKKKPRRWALRIMVALGSGMGLQALAEDPPARTPFGIPVASPQAVPYGMPMQGSSVDGSPQLPGAASPGAGGMAAGDPSSLPSNPAIDGSAGASGGAPGSANPTSPDGSASGLFSSAGNTSLGLGGAEGVAAAPPFMVGDQGTFAQGVLGRFPTLAKPTSPGLPTLNSAAIRSRAVNSIVPAVRGFKIADNQSPRPVDRVFADFNYFNNVNSALNRKLGADISNQQVYHQLYGFEKTFFDQQASIGIRVPVNSLTISAPVSSGLRGASTAAGNMSIFGKYILAEDRSTGSLLSAGLNLTVPTGPGAFAGFKNIQGSINPVQIQPFLGYIIGRDRLFFQGFGAVDVPTDSRQPTMLYLDSAIGYYAYRSDQPGRFLSAVVPAFEQHLNTPFNHRGYSLTDQYAIPDVLDFTFAANFIFRDRAYLSVAYVTPVTVNKPFSGELAVLFNYRFGRNRQPFVPVVGQ